MKKTIATIATIAILTGCASTTTAPTSTRPTDGSLTCAQIAAEFLQLEAAKAEGEKSNAQKLGMAFIPFVGLIAMASRTDTYSFDSRLRELAGLGKGKKC